MSLRLAAAAALMLTLAGCDSAPAPIDNAAATNCVPGTPEDEASALCQDVELANGAEVVAGDNFATTEDVIPSNELVGADYAN